MSDNLVAELVVDVPADDSEYSAWVRSWFEAMWDVFANLGVLDSAAAAALVAGGPRRIPAGMRATLSCAPPKLGGKHKHRAYSAASLDWAYEMACTGNTVSFLLSTVDERKFYRTREFVLANVWRDDNDKRWARFGMDVPEEPLSTAVGGAFQSAALDALHRLADLSNPVYGEMGYPGKGHCTGLEYALHNWGLFDSYPRARHHLRGYNWVTIIPQELVVQLGGLDEIAKSGAFAVAGNLASGGAWLRATTDFADYDLAHATRVFQAVARVLPPGLPRLRKEHGVPPKRTPVVLQDAVTFGARP